MGEVSEEELERLALKACERVDCTSTAVAHVQGGQHAEVRVTTRHPNGHTDHQWVEVSMNNDRAPEALFAALRVLTGEVSDGSGTPYAEWPAFDSIDEWLEIEAQLAEDAGVEVRHNWPKLARYANSYTREVVDAHIRGHQREIELLKRKCRAQREQLKSLNRLCESSNWLYSWSENLAIHELQRKLQAARAEGARLAAKLAKLRGADDGDVE